MRRDNSRDLRRRVQALGLRTRGARLPAELRGAIIRHARARRQHGDGVRQIALSIGVSPESIRRWTTMSQPAETRALVPVVVRDRDDVAVGTVAVIAPSGYRVEGLSVASAAELLRQLA